MTMDLNPVNISPLSALGTRLCVCVWGGCLCVGEAGEVGRGSPPVYVYSSWEASDSCNGFSSAQQATAPGGQGKFLLYPIC